MGKVWGQAPARVKPCAKCKTDFTYTNGHTIYCPSCARWYAKSQHRKANAAYIARGRKPKPDAELNNRVSFVVVSDPDPESAFPKGATFPSMEIRDMTNAYAFNIGTVLESRGKRYTVRLNRYGRQELEKCNG